MLQKVHYSCATRSEGLSLAPGRELCMCLTQASLDLPGCPRMQRGHGLRRLLQQSWVRRTTLAAKDTMSAMSSQSA